MILKWLSGFTKQKRWTWRTRVENVSIRVLISLIRVKVCLTTRSNLNVSNGTKGNEMWLQLNGSVTPSHFWLKYEVFKFYFQNISTS